MFWGRPTNRSADALVDFYHGSINTYLECISMLDLRSEFSLIDESKHLAVLQFKGSYPASLEGLDSSKGWGTLLQVTCQFALTFWLWISIILFSGHSF